VALAEDEPSLCSRFLDATDSNRNFDIVYTSIKRAEHWSQSASLHYVTMPRQVAHVVQQCKTKGTVIMASRYLIEVGVQCVCSLY